MITFAARCDDYSARCPRADAEITPLTPIYRRDFARGMRASRQRMQAYQAVSASRLVQPRAPGPASR